MYKPHFHTKKDLLNWHLANPGYRPQMQPPAVTSTQSGTPTPMDVSTTSTSTKRKSNTSQVHLRCLRVFRVRVRSSMVFETRIHVPCSRSTRTWTWNRSTSPPTLRRMAKTLPMGKDRIRPWNRRRRVPRRAETRNSPRV